MRDDLDRILYSSEMDPERDNEDMDMYEERELKLVQHSIESLIEYIQKDTQLFKYSFSDLIDEILEFGTKNQLENFKFDLIYTLETEYKIKFSCYDITGEKIEDLNIRTITEFVRFLLFDSYKYISDSLCDIFDKEKLALEIYNIIYLFNYNQGVGIKKFLINLENKVKDTNSIFYNIVKYMSITDIMECLTKIYIDNERLISERILEKHGLLIKQSKN